MKLIFCHRKIAIHTCFKTYFAHVGYVPFIYAFRLCTRAIRTIIWCVGPWYKALQTKQPSLSKRCKHEKLFFYWVSRTTQTSLLSNLDYNIFKNRSENQNDDLQLIVGHPEPEKKILLAFLSTFWHPCSKCILMCFKKDRGGCQVWKCLKVPELGQRSTECKFLYIRQILAFLSISYPKL